jgi:hypothetical protein
LKPIVQHFAAKIISKLRGEINGKSSNIEREPIVEEEKELGHSARAVKSQHICFKSVVTIR